MKHLPGAPLLSYLLPRLQDAFFLAVLLGVLGLGPRLLNQDGDLGRHLTIGGYILDTKSIPRLDIFSHTMSGQPLTPHEWLAQVAFALAYRLGRLDGVTVLCAALLALTFTIVYREGLRRSQMPLAALFFALLAAAAASLHWLARPHLFTMLLTAVWAWGLERLERRGMTWLLAGAMLIWANLHGAFIVGFAILAIVIGGEILETWVLPKTQPAGGAVNGAKNARLRALLMVGGAALAATLVNPAGLGLWETSLGYLGSRYLVGHTMEYLPPNFHSLSAWPFLLMITLSLLAGLGSRRLPARWVLLLAGWTAMALYSARNIPLYAILAGPILAELYAGLARETPLAGGFVRLQTRLSAVEANLRGAVWPAAAVVLAAAALFSGARLDFGQRGNQFLPQVFPAAAVDWLEANPLPGEMFNDFTWGGYLLYRSWPERRVFIDGQTDFYGERLTRQYEQVITLDAGWEQVLADYRVAWAILPPQSPLAARLAADPAWQPVYQDETAVILARKP
jgi:hypothetical protein